MDPAVPIKPSISTPISTQPADTRNGSAALSNTSPASQPHLWQSIQISTNSLPMSSHRANLSVQGPGRSSSKPNLLKESRSLPSYSVVSSISSMSDMYANLDDPRSNIKSKRSGCVMKPFRIEDAPESIADGNTPPDAVNRKMSRSDTQLISLANLPKKFDPKEDSTSCDPKPDPKRSSGQIKRKIFGEPVAAMSEVPSFFRQCICHLESHVDKIGIFRLSASSVDVQILKAKFENDEKVVIEQQDPFVVSHVIVSFLQLLPEPILTSDLYYPLLKTQENTNEDSRVRSIQFLISSLPTINRQICSLLLRLLIKICAKSDVNKMTPSNIAVVLSPLILRAPELPEGEGDQDPTQELFKSLRELQVSIKVLVDFLNHAEEIFPMESEMGTGMLNEAGRQRKPRSRGLDELKV
eukprot:TRINITY_DN4603_c0_g1_i1.p1 TRINITY_DN4603_c0_g1~~TRINITY_DN4603_c0_g1_i1.p1  ORF type:complete len:436 (-),score=76.15 TRINITY_DN4603_c0_g1_i1:81-1313(-)